MHPPAVAHQSIYAVTVERGVASLATDTGAIQWQAELEVDATAAPTVAGDTLLIGTQTGVVGFDAHTGERLWAFNTQSKITGSPIVAGDAMYVVSHDGVLYAVTASK